MYCERGSASSGGFFHKLVAAPQRLGMFGVWVDAQRSGLPEDSPVRPDRIISSVRELCESR